MLGRKWLDALERRLLRYVVIDTQSQFGKEEVPSTAKQLDLSRLLVAEMRGMGITDAEMDAFGYVLASIPATSSDMDIPTVAFLAHVDTAPDFSGTDVKPIMHRAYAGGPLILPESPDTPITETDSPDLPEKVGEDIVTASGKTLLGADNKAGVAIIMTLAEYLMQHPEVDHGRIRLCFTRDEEAGRGVDQLSLQSLGANVAYTVDGGDAGEIVYETFSADLATIAIRGVAIHPGDAKGRMVNAIRLTATLLSRLPKDGMTPETTEGREGFIHPGRVSGDASEMQVELYLRDFELDGLAAKGDLVRYLCRQLQDEEPRSVITCQVVAQYRNMRYWLETDRRPVDLALEATRRAGLIPITRPTRGGTDGSRLTEMGLPTPDLFTGAHNMHGPKEWVSIQDMARSVSVCLELAKLWAADGRGYGGWRDPSANA